jgi:acyl-CoA thioester hydrolase
VPRLPPVLTRLSILPDWIDGNGHMNVAYYVLAFDRATDVFYDALGIGWSYVERQRKSLFTLAMNVDYLREMVVGADARIVTRLLDHDHKRIHYFHEMSDGGGAWLAATNELLAMHVDLATRRSAAFPEAVLARLAAMQSAHAGLPPPAQLGRKLGIRRGEPLPTGPS